MSKIRIYISCHENSWTPDSTILTPVQVGAELIDAKYDMIHDNDGQDNISCLNRSYCELTAQYWAWKNDDSDYCGFMHYRRYFIFNESVNYPSEPFGYVKADRVDTEVLKEFKITDKNIETCVDGYDVIVPKQGSTGKETIYEQYKSSHNSRDFDVVLEIIRTRTPEIYDTALEYVNGDHGYFCNMFIMRRELFQEYSKWLFSIMDEFDKTEDCSNYKAIHYRVNGYLA